MENTFDKRDIFITGKTLYLKALTENDVVSSDWYGWFNNEEVTQRMQKHYFPNTMEMQLEYYRTQIKGQQSRLQLGIVTINKPEHLIGCVSLNKIDYINRKTDMSVMIAEKEGRNIVTYLEASSLIITHAFKTLNMRKVYGGTIIKEVADMMCRVLGFKQEGIVRQDVYKNGIYHDVYLIGLLEGEFTPLK